MNAIFDGGAPALAGDSILDDKIIYLIFDCTLSRIFNSTHQ
jgi:hypothetical protein